MASKRASFPTVAAVRAALAYDKKSGKLTWKIQRGPVHAGAEAGSVAPKGYMQVGFAGTQWGAHILAFVIAKGRWPKAHIDHIDGDGFNNAWKNLREATPAQNGRNRTRGANANNKSTNVRGVYALPNGKFAAFLHLHVGTFTEIPRAQRAIERARNLYHGSFANRAEARTHG